MKINFSNQTVSITTAVSFSIMGTLEDLLQTAIMEAAEKLDGDKVDEICNLATQFGIFLDLDLIEIPATGDPLGNDQEGSEGQEKYLPDPAPSE